MAQQHQGSCWTDEQAAAVRVAVERIATSAVLRQSPRQQRLLRYLVNATLAGDSALLKGYRLGIEVFDRAPDFDPRIDPIVRVEVGRLRGKLIEYYAGVGRDDPALIDLPTGAYVPRIDFRSVHPPAGVVHIITTGLEERPSLVVLPFTNISNNPAQDYWADGINEDLITDLSKLSGLFVISRHSAFVYKDVQKRVEQIGAELGVRYVLEGSMRRGADTVRITAQLIDAKQGGHLSAQRYDRELGVNFAVQDVVTRNIVAALEVQLTRQEMQRLGHEGATSIEARDWLLRGLQRFWSYTKEENAAAQTCFRRAIELDPSYAASYAWLARSYVFQFIVCRDEAAKHALEAACEHAYKAVELDSLLPLAHSMVSWVELWRRQSEASIKSARRAIALDPNNADAHLYCSLILSASGRAEEGLRQIETAMRSNPHPAVFYLFALSQCYFALERY